VLSRWQPPVEVEHARGAARPKSRMRTTELRLNESALVRTVGCTSHRFECARRVEIHEARCRPVPHCRMPNSRHSVLPDLFVAGHSEDSRARVQGRPWRVQADPARRGAVPQRGFTIELTELRVSRKSG
jgi:hypothetical protein